MGNHEPKYLCLACSHEIYTLRGYRQHMTTHIYDADIFHCPDVNCNYISGNKKSLFTHFKKHIYEKELKRFTDRIEYLQQITLRTYYVIRKFHRIYNFNNPLIGSICFNCLKYPNDLEYHKCIRHKLDLSFCNKCDSCVENQHLISHNKNKCELRTVFHFIDIYTNKKYYDSENKRNN